MSESQNQSEQHQPHNTMYDKLAKVLQKEDKSQLVLSSNVTIDDIRKWVPRVLESMSKSNPEEEKRKTHRENKHFETPVNFALIAGNTDVQFKLDKDGKMKKEAYEVNHDVAEFIFQEILNHGRQTANELERHLGGWDPHLLAVVTNALLFDHWLEKYTEEDGLETLELVDSKERLRKLDYDNQQRKILEDNNKVNKKSNNNKISCLSTQVEVISYQPKDKPE